MSAPYNTSQINSEFLLGLLLEENKYIVPIDFIQKGDKASDYCCVFVAMALAKEYQMIQNCFSKMDEFLTQYFSLYANALENYRSAVGSIIRQTFIDEAKIFYPLETETFTISQLVSDQTKKNDALNMLELVKQKHSYVIILRDEIAFIAIHHQDDNFILIDPHAECCGVVSKTGVYRYTVYDGVWNFDVHVINQTTPVTTIQDDSEVIVVNSIASSPQENTEVLTIVSIPEEPVVEPVVESVVEPVVESVVEPVVESVVESVVEPVVESVVEPTAESASNNLADS
jgi:hypothetical protein